MHTAGYGYRRNPLSCMKTPVNLASLRAAIKGQSRTRFDYQGVLVTADLYLLGCAKKTGAYVVLGWAVDPTPGWDYFRYSVMKELEVLGPMGGLRPDYNPYDPYISIIDTYLPAVRAKDPHG
jgi:hypothetical protein